MPMNSSNIDGKITDIMYRLGFIMVKAKDPDIQKAAKEAYDYLTEIRGEIDTLLIREITQMYLELEESMKADKLEDEQYSQDAIDAVDTPPADEHNEDEDND